jgi:acetoin utilization deacetylase AcuC-like enzyme
MGRSAILIDREFLKHLPGQGHPERPERLRVLLDLAESLNPAAFQLLPPRPASQSEIELCHAPNYVKLVESTASLSRYALDGDTVTSQESFNVALLATGGFLRLLDSVAARESSNGFAMVRPPGHHALRNQAMGFCLFNTIAIGAQYLKTAHGAKRIAIVDWDVHHGNGTQDAFYNDPSVLFISTHQYPFYPGTGGIAEVGEKAGMGYTLNVPLPSGCGDAEYGRVFRDIVVPAVARFAPEWILISAGFDPHRRDPLAGMNVTEHGFSMMSRAMLQLAETYCGGKIAFLLEGGYDLAALKSSVAGVLETLQRPPVDDKLAAAVGGEKIDPVIRAVLKTHEQLH